MGKVAEQRPRCYPVRNMRTQIFLALFLAPCLAGFGQTATTPQPGLPKDARAVFAAAEQLYDFGDPSLKPWHLKATYQLYDDKGNPTEQGTLEYWRASPKVHRSSWSRPGATHSVWYFEDGKEAFTASGDRLGYFEAGLPTELFAPLKSASEMVPAKARLERNDFKISNIKFACLSEFTLTAERPPDFRVLPTYCFDMTLPALEIQYAFQGSVITIYNRIARYQGKFLARSIETAAGKQKLFSAEVNSVDALDPSDPALIPPNDANYKADGAEAGVKLDSLLKKQLPLYPWIAKENREQGTVLIDAAISIDGKIKDPRVLSSPSPTLSASSLEAVSHWEYKPYLLNGTPVEVDTVIAVSYTLGR